MVGLKLMSGTFGAHPGHDGHILGTLSGIQILVMQDALHQADTESIVRCKCCPSHLAYRTAQSFNPQLRRIGTVKRRILLSIDRQMTLPLIAVLLSLVAPDGRVSGDQFGESDTRFAYILIQSLSLLGRLSNLDALFDGNGRNAVVENILGCMNFDGAFGTEPGAESHGGQGGFGPLCLHLHGPCGGGDLSAPALESFRSSEACTSPVSDS